jgi:hypothetical protein
VKAQTRIFLAVCVGMAIGAFAMLAGFLTAWIDGLLP